jgi:hypothetical protein
MATNNEAPSKIYLPREIRLATKEAVELLEATDVRHVKRDRHDYKEEE